VTSRALAALAACLSPIFMIAAIIGWVAGLLPANPLTLGIAVAVVLGGPLLGIVHVATAWEPGVDREPRRRRRAVAQVAEARGLEASRANTTFMRPEAPARPAPPHADLFTRRVGPAVASARAFHRWRDNPHPAIVARERSDQLAQNAQRAVQLRRERFHNA
jgi:hypothetical protein